MPGHIPLGPWAEVLRDGQDFSQAEMKVKNFPEGGNHRDTIMKCKGTGLVSGVPCFFHTLLFCFMAANPVACSYPGILSYTVRRSCKASLVVNTYFAHPPLLLLHGGGCMERCFYFSEQSRCPWSYFVSASSSLPLPRPVC